MTIILTIAGILAVCALIPMVYIIFFFPECKDPYESE